MILWWCFRHTMCPSFSHSLLWLLASYVAVQQKGFHLARPPAVGSQSGRTYSISSRFIYCEVSKVAVGDRWAVVSFSVNLVLCSRVLVLMYFYCPMILPSLTHSHSLSLSLSLLLTHSLSLSLSPSLPLSVIHVCAHTHTHLYTPRCSK